MSNAAEIASYLDGILATKDFKDDSQNGLQVESKPLKVKKVALAVDSGLSIIDEAIKLKCQLLIVHHGLFWNKSYLINEIFGKKIRKLIENGCSLYASHLPLDAHLKLGNAAGFVNFLNANGFKLTEIKPHFLYNKVNHIGAKVVSKKPISIEQITQACAKLPGAINPIVLPFGRKDIKNIGIVTGSGSSALEECAKEGLDLLLSGEAKQSAYHLAKELGINAVFAGHYATETFGVMALGKELERKFKIKSYFINEPTGI